MEQAILTVLAACSVGSAVMYGVKQLLDQLPDAITSWRRAVSAWRTHDGDGTVPASSSDDRDTD